VAKHATASRESLFRRTFASVFRIILSISGRNHEIHPNRSSIHYCVFVVIDDRAARILFQNETTKIQPQLDGAITTVFFDAPTVGSLFRRILPYREIGRFANDHRPSERVNTVVANRFIHSPRVIGVRNTLSEIVSPFSTSRRTPFAVNIAIDDETPVTVPTDHGNRIH